MKTFIIAILAITAFTFGACESATEQTKTNTIADKTTQSDNRAKDEAAIRKLPIEDWCKAEANRDLDAKMKLYTEDIVFMVPGEESIKGQAAVRAKHEEWWKDTKYECTGEIVEVKISDDWGAISGTFSGTVTEADGKTRKEKGKFINLVRRESDGWKISRVIWNIN